MLGVLAAGRSLSRVGWLEVWFTAWLGTPAPKRDTTAAATAAGLETCSTRSHVGLHVLQAGHDLGLLGCGECSGLSVLPPNRNVQQLHFATVRLVLHANRWQVRLVTWQLKTWKTRAGLPLRCGVAGKLGLPCLICAVRERRRLGTGGERNRLPRSGSQDLRARRTTRPRMVTARIQDPLARELFEPAIISGS